MDGGAPTPNVLGESLDELIDRAVAAINRGDRAEAATLAGQVLNVDRSNADATDLLEAERLADNRIEDLSADVRRCTGPPAAALRRHRRRPPI